MAATKPAQILVFICLSFLGTCLYADTKYKTGKIYKIEINDSVISPTQIPYGAAEVEKVREEIRTTENMEELLKENIGEAILGPDGMLYLRDGHHFVKALMAEGKKEFYVEIEKVYDREEWTDLEFKRELEGLVFLRDENGKKVTLKDVLAIRWSTMRDDPYRSLAWLLRKMKVFEKVRKEYVEFDIADFLRKYMEIEAPIRSEAKLIEYYFQALQLVWTKDAAQALPGWPDGMSKDCRRFRDFTTAMTTRR